MLSPREPLLAAVLLAVANCSYGAQRAAPAAGGDQGQPIIAGAIRWDAWHGDRSEVGKAVQRSLGPQKWHGRLPFFAQVLGNDQARIDGASQSVMDREIGYARAADLDYWAFLLYSDGSAMNHGLEHYLSSTRKRGLRFCLILEQGQWGTEKAAAAQFERAASLMIHADYQRIAGARPLLYILTADPASKAWGVQQVETAMDRLRSLARRNKSAEPYIVVLDFNSGRAARLRREINAEAISTYAYQRDGKSAPYAQLAQEVERFWDECRSTGSAVVPIVMTGWDRRPRVERPVFWETWQQPNDGIEKFYEAPTAPELSMHLGHAVEWIQEHPDASPAKAILIYAWNENDEGGWLVPTRNDGSSRLRAVRSALRQKRIQPSPHHGSR